MDNTAANICAMGLLEAEIPTTLALGCNAHALNLAFKDFANSNMCK
jgi:hypothetical protein